MIDFEKRTLGNGLRVIHHRDRSSQLAVVNVLYDVGSRDESENRTGFAHLFEHLMFGGSVNIPDFDRHVEEVGGTNNAFTTSDYTNYYTTVPKAALETGLWLESDRMLSLAFSERSLEVQRQVVIEEFRQRYLNQPYGDLWLELRPLAYEVHPYKWATIGKDISHIEGATMDDVKAFFYSHYAPNNAILVVVADYDSDYVFSSVERWFGDIERRAVSVRNLPQEPRQVGLRRKTLERDVPYDRLTMVFKMAGRNSAEFNTLDLVSDLLSSGESARLYRKLVMDNPLFGYLDASVMGEMDPSLFVITGQLHEGVSLEQAEEAVWNELRLLSREPVGNYEFEKLMNKAKSIFVFSEINPLNKAMILANAELRGGAELVNKELEIYQSVRKEEVFATSAKIFREENASILNYSKTEK